MEFFLNDAKKSFNLVGFFGEKLKGLRLFETDFKN